MCGLAIPVGTGLHKPALERDTYVWEKEASYGECQSEQQVKNYFTRLGMILCICHLCHSGDMHYENMVAAGSIRY